MGPDVAVRRSLEGPEILLNQPARERAFQGECLVPVSARSQARPPPGQSLKSFPAPRPSTCMRPQETRMIRGDRLSRCTTVSMPSSVPGDCTRYSVR
jgi:hypothetical protein